MEGPAVVLWAWLVIGSNWTHLASHVTLLTLFSVLEYHQQQCYTSRSGVSEGWCVNFIRSPHPGLWSSFASASFKQVGDNIHCTSVIQSLLGNLTSFLSWAKPHMEKLVSNQYLSHWIVKAVSLTYTSRGLQPPAGLCARSIRVLVTSWAPFKGVSIYLCVCRFCTNVAWTLTHTVPSSGSQVMALPWGATGNSRPLYRKLGNSGFLSITHRTWMLWKTT